MKALQFQQQQQVDENMSNLTSASGDQASVSSGNRSTEIGTSNFSQQYFPPPPPQISTQGVKRKRNQPGNPDPDAEVIALSPKTLMATNRFICEICNKGFQRDQNLQLHKRGHNLPWKLKQRSSKEVRKKVYVCPEASCVHHDPSRALGDLTGIKKHFFRKHGEKKWKCEKCSKKYAVQSDWKAHSKTCGTREYRCDCGTLFSRRDSFITHRAFCDALAEESARAINPSPANPLFISSSSSTTNNTISQHLMGGPHINFNPQGQGHDFHAYSSAFMKKEQQHNDHHQQQQLSLPPWLANGPPPNASSVFSANQNQDHPQPQPHHHHHGHDFESNPNPSLGPTLPQFQVPASSSAGLAAAAISSPPHMSATALLQKAAQMGATTGTNSGSVSVPAGIMLRSHPGGHVSDFGDYVSAAAGGSGGGSHHQQQQQHQSSLLNDMMNSLSSGTGFEGTSFEDAFVGMLGSSRGRDGGSMAAGADENGGSGGEGLTRDFLGLRALSHSDMMLNIAGLGNCVSSNSTSTRDSSQINQQVPQKPNWQG